MRMIIDYAGNRYETPATDEVTAEQAKDALYSQLEKLNKLELQLEGGGFLLLGPKAVESCAIQILDA